MKLAKRLNLIKEYAFLLLIKKKIEIEKTTGKKVIDLSIGSPNFPPSIKYIKKLKEFISQPDAYLYPGYKAITEFSQGLKFWYKKRFNVKLEDEEILPLLGAKEGVSYLPLVLLDKKDDVLVPDPGYPGFFGPAKMIEANLIFYNLTEDNDFKINFDELEKKLTKKTKFIWINFPANPTGQVATIIDLEKVVSFAKKYRIWLIYDNAYSEITFDGFKAPSILQIKGAKDISVEIGSFSKTFSFAGFRMGWIVGNKSLIKALTKVKSQFDSGMSRPLQKLGGFVLTNFDDFWYKQMIKSYKERRDKIINSLKKIGLSAKKTKGSLYLWVKIPNGYKDSQEFVFDLLEKKQILLTPGTIFGKNGKRFVRISISSNVDNIEKYL